jgi:hypothetical protein
MVAIRGIYLLVHFVFGVTAGEDCSLANGEEDAHHVLDAG